MNDSFIVEALLRRDPFVTKLFFYRNCKPLFTSLANHFSQGTKRWEYDEVVNEIYALLMENDGRRLRTFGFTCSLYQWIKVVALHHLTAHEDVVIDSCSHSPLYEQGVEADFDDSAPFALPEEDSSQEAEADLQRLLDRMPNRRYADVIRKLTIEGFSHEELAREMNIKASNLYNIKRRAMTMLCDVVGNDKQIYQTSPGTSNKTTEGPTHRSMKSGGKAQGDSGYHHRK